MSEDLYQALILARSREPLYAGRPPQFDACGAGENRMCGDEVSVFFTRAQRSWRHESHGCAILLASADLMCGMLAGRDEADLAWLGPAFETLAKTGDVCPDLGDLNALASIARYPARLRCATLPWSAARHALEDVGAGRGEHG